MKTNLYISDLNRPSSYQIAQYFRQDHQQVNPNIRIIGSSSTLSQHPWIHASIDFQQHPQLACRAVLDCDIIILDLRSPTHEAQTIIRFLNKANSDLSKMIRIIGLSSLLTWEGTKAFALQSQKEDKQTMMASICDQSKWRPTQFEEADYPKRIPNVLANRMYQLENMLLDLNQGKIKASVLGVGIVYGKQSQAIQSEILKSLCGQTLTLWGEGSNVLPLVHIQSLLQSLKVLIDSDVKYAIVRDEKVFTQKEVKQIILQTTHSQASLSIKQPLFVTEEQSIWTFQQRIASSSIFKSITQQRNFQTYCLSHILADLCEYTEWTPCQSVLLTDKFDPEILQSITSKVGLKIQLIQEEEITKLNQQILLKSIDIQSLQRQKQSKKIPRQQLIQQQLQNLQPRYAQAISTLLAPKRYTNFIVICSSKLKQFLSEELFFKGISFIVQEGDNTWTQKQIVYNSRQWYQLTGLQDDEQRQDVSEALLERVPEKVVYSYQEGRLKKDQKIVLTTQYLLDNVLGAISEAKFHLRTNNKTGLRSFIQQLKAIYARSNYQSCFGNAEENTLADTALTMIN